MLFEVVLRQSYKGRAVLNRWHYNSSGVPAAVSLSFALVSAFGGIPDELTSEFPDDTIMKGLAEVQSEDLVYVELSATALYDVTDFYSVPYAPSQAGTQGGTPMSPFMAYTFSSNRVRTDIRRGFKRFAGVSEQYVGDGGVIEAGMPALLTTLAGRMSGTLEYDDEGNTLSFQPVVLSLELQTPVTDPRRYELYPTLAEQLEHAALGINWTAGAFVTTQNTRKA